MKILQNDLANEARGMFSHNPDGYPEYAAWATKVKIEIKNLIDRRLYLSNIASEEDLAPILKLCDLKTEAAVHLIVANMIQEGITWEHLALLRTLVGRSPVPKEHSGKFYLQIADWLYWYSQVFDK
jgi:triacylglycerol esterase/lipase EstA (alpha/beta hydrolase family)